MLAKVGQKASKRTITKSTDIHKIYMNYNNGNDYIMVKDGDPIEKSRIIPDPPHNSRKKDIILNP